MPPAMIFSQFFKITYNNAVKNFAKFRNIFKICKKKLRNHFSKMHKIKVSAIQILINDEDINAIKFCWKSGEGVGG